MSGTQNTSLSPREPIADANGFITRSWWRKIDALLRQSGTTAAPLVVQSSALLSGGTVSAGGTISTPAIPAGSLIGNPGNIAGQPGTLHLDPSLSFNGNSLALADIAPGTLLGNAGTIAATPGTIIIGGGLTLDSAGTLSAPSGADAQTLIYSLSDRSGQIADLERKTDDALMLAILAGSGSTQAGTTAQAIYAPLVTGGLPGPQLVSDPYGQCVMVQVR